MDLISKDGQCRGNTLTARDQSLLKDLAFHLHHVRYSQDMDPNHLDMNHIMGRLRHPEINSHLQTVGRLILNLLVQSTSQETHLHPSDLTQTTTYTYRKLTDQRQIPSPSTAKRKTHQLHQITHPRPPAQLLMIL
jgi:hypothetical protein